MTPRIATSFLFICLLTSGTLLHAQDKEKAAGKAISLSRAAQTANLKAQSITGARVACQGGEAAGYPCELADLMAFVPVEDLLAGLHDSSLDTNDIWGWTDPENGDEYVMIGLLGGTSFVKITDPENPQVLGFLPTHTSPSIWRDIKVYADHAFIVSEANAHGMQVFDLTQLRTAGTTPQLFQETTHYDNVSSVHNIAINEDSGFAYLVGSGGGGETCGGGLHMVNIQDPLSPEFAGCFTSGYTHDVQCVIYNGPDAEHQGREICVESSVKDVVVTDVTDKANPFILGTGTYPQVEYVHQGWFTEDHRYFLQGDELDESRLGVNTKTIIWDMEDLSDPVILTEFIAETPVIDHNLYVKGNLVYQSNYNGGLRILDIADPANPVEVAFFDTRPNDESVGFSGSWSNYPYFESGTIAVSSGTEGLFLISPNVVETAVESPDLPSQLTLTPAYPNPFDEETVFTLTVDRPQQIAVMAYDMLGRQVAVLYKERVSSNTPVSLTFDARNLPNGKYIVRATGESATHSRVVTLIR